jgi:hypothetical protein
LEVIHFQESAFSKIGGLNGGSCVLHEMQEETGNGENRTGHHEEWPESIKGKVQRLRHWYVQNPWQII